jgi:hypothetical protein
MLIVRMTGLHHPRHPVHLHLPPHPQLHHHHCVAITFIVGRPHALHRPFHARLRPFHTSLRPLRPFRPHGLARIRPLIRLSGTNHRDHQLTKLDNKAADESNA